MARLLDKYVKDVQPRLAKQLGQKNSHALPRLTKIVVNMGVGQAAQDRKRLEEATANLATITGQKPLITKAKQAISAFRLRQGMEIGCKVTLRGRRMYEFLDRLISLALPRVRDFRGLSPRAFDGHGNYTLGLSEQLVFPEIQADKVAHTQGMHISLVTTAASDDDARVLLKELGLPISSD
ncbi:MAG TPA: 50S ribosomal protein L5 [Planctomycetaceae bacterium]|nr:50S ribosomal protein L5 [Planctomycetaceae bacterium]